ncbi:hypothetical protein PGTUg99_013034 [Puccinia graminis f. sp. tritici]|uniref:Pali-domain-containing protein n=1 Tax=Puccinia graminis f. sp. tritici TaxID=56615 RepID=A0A5B0RZR7_PUCGR|nr:hypothetical protein PGTUg99_013034 [Puccinia graminis f. sp. tritici]
MPFGPNTPGTLIILAGSVLLVLSTISNPIIKSFYFLSIELSSKLAGIPLDGNIKLGTFGYCLTLGTQLACIKPKLGYDLQLDTLGIPLPSQLDLSALKTVISALTYALILHPIAAGLALLSAIFGIISHIREYSRSCWTSCFSSLAATAALLAFVLDIVAFSLAKNRLNAISDPNVSINAQLGNAIWITLAGWLCLTLSGFFFCAGRCLFARRHRKQAQADQLRPIPDQDFTQRMRIDAHEAEKAREKAFTPKDQSNLPAFAEYTDQHHNNQENIPLNRFNPHDEQVYNDQFHQQQHSTRSPDSYPSETVSGVGTGYLQPPHQPLAHHLSVSSRPSIYSDTGAAPPHQLVDTFFPPLPPMPPQHMGAPTNDMYHNLPPHVSPASHMMNSPHRTPSTLTNRRLPQSLIPAGGMASPPGSYSSHPNGMPPVGVYQSSRSNSYTSPPPSSSSQATKPTMAYPSYERAHQRQTQDSFTDPAQQYLGGHRGQPSDYLPSPHLTHPANLDSDSHRPPPQPASHAYHESSQTHEPYNIPNLSEEPGELQESNAQYPTNQNQHLNRSGHQFDNRSTVYSQATTMPVYPHGAQSYPHHMISSPLEDVDEQSMYGGTDFTAPLAIKPKQSKPNHSNLTNTVSQPYSLPPLSFSPPPTHRDLPPQSENSPSAVYPSYDRNPNLRSHA